MLNKLAEATTIPVKANIRLGTRVGKKLNNEAFFVLSEAPEVKEVYGESPEFLEIVFPGDDLNAIAPAQLEYWKGTRDSQGNIVDGKLICSGPGRFNDGTPGVALWKDRERTPPPEDCISPRDSRGFIQRYCKDEQCCDWTDEKGYPKCKQTMRLYFIIPRVSITNVYRITTHSWNSMFEFYSYLDWVKKTEGLAFKPFKIYKEAKTVTYWDRVKGKEYSRAMPILRIEKDDMFLKVYGSDIKDKMKQLRDNRFFLMAPPPAEPILLDSAEQPPEEEKPLSPAQRADMILADPEVQEGFAKLEAAMGKPLDLKSRQMYVLRKEGAEDVKMAVLDGLTKSVLTIMANKDPGVATEEKPAEEPVVEESPKTEPEEPKDLHLGEPEVHDSPENVSTIEDVEESDKNIEGVEPSSQG